MLKAPLRQESDSGDIPDPELPTGSTNTEPAPSSDFCAPSPAPQLPPTAASLMDDPSQEWRLVKIKRVLIAPSSEPRKASKDLLSSCKAAQRHGAAASPANSVVGIPPMQGIGCCALGLFYFWMTSVPSKIRGICAIPEEGWGGTGGLPQSPRAEQGIGVPQGWRQILGHCVGFGHLSSPRTWHSCAAYGR